MSYFAAVPPTDIERNRDFVTPDTIWHEWKVAEESIKEYLPRDWSQMMARYRREKGREKLLLPPPSEDIQARWPVVVQNLARLMAKNVLLFRRLWMYRFRASFRERKPGRKLCVNNLRKKIYIVRESKNSKIYKRDDLKLCKTWLKCQECSFFLWMYRFLQKKGWSKLFEFQIRVNNFHEI